MVSGFQVPGSGIGLSYRRGAREAVQNPEVLGNVRHSALFSGRRGGCGGGGGDGLREGDAHPLGAELRRGEEGGGLGGDTRVSWEEAGVLGPGVQWGVGF